ncbi:MAG: sulfite exporter TauE/SafE family protein [Prolixibacteraceae bacterium]|nr:sulfite exporter TauE/SafE family protein [Prolixibacteraceae bacterium]
METFLASLYENSSTPLISAFILGLMTAISPCPMATNITAIGFISKDAINQKRVFTNGLIYTAGRAFSYTTLATLLFLGASKSKISLYFQQYGEKILGPLLIITGIFMLGILTIRFPAFQKLSNRIEKAGKWNFLNVFLIGVIFAMAFCPYSGVLYFGILIPLTIGSVKGLFLPIIFAVATGIPVIIIAWFLAFAISNVGRFYNVLKTIEFWMRRIIAILFIGVGIYYVYTIYIA